MAEKLSAPLQESIIALIATNDKQGRIASGLLTATSFDESYQDFAGRLIEYHKHHGRAPGKAHLDDLVDDVLTNPNHKKHKHYVRIIQGILEQSDALNAKYLLGRISDFSERQLLKSALLDASDRYAQGGDELVDDVKQILLKAMQYHPEEMDAGVFLNDKVKGLSFLEKQQLASLTGIPALDKHGVGPRAGQILLFIGAKGVGKSWWCVDLGKRCLMQNLRVVHVTLEMPWPQVVQRYYQSLFAMPVKSGDYNVTQFEFDKLKRLTGFSSKKRTPRLSQDDPDIHKLLGKKIDKFGARLGRLVVKEFATSSLTISKLEAYLDFLEVTSGFIPNVLIVDYPDLMFMGKGKDDFRLSLGQVFKDIRGLLQRRNLAGIIPTQGNRSSWDAATVKASMISEDSSKVMTADMTIIYSQTPTEYERGLARLSVAHNRGGEDKFTVLIAQSYASGQFVLHSTRMPGNYQDLIGPPGGDVDDDDQPNRD